MMIQNNARNAEMVRRYGQGETYESIAVDFDLTRERVRQIVSSLGGPSALDSSQARRAKREQEWDNSVTRVLEAVRDPLQRMANRGIGKAEALEMITALFPERNADLLSAAIRRSGIPFDYATEDTRFTDDLVRCSLLYCVAVKYGWHCEASDALDWLAPEIIRDLGSCLKPAEIPMEKFANVLCGIAGSLMHIDQDDFEQVRAGVLTKNEYDSFRLVVLRDLGLTSSKGKAPWPATSQTIMKRLGGGYWNDALSVVGFPINTKGRARGQLVFAQSDYLGALTAFFNERRSLGLRESMYDYQNWTELEAAEGRQRPSFAAVRLVFGSWQAAKRAAISGLDPVMDLPVTSPRATHSAVFSVRSRAQLEHGLMEIESALHVDKVARIEDLFKSMMGVLERNWRIWFRDTVEGSPNLEERIKEGNIKPTVKELFRQGGVSAALSDKNLDSLLNFRRGIDTGPWLPEEAKEQIANIDGAIMHRLALAREARNLATHGSSEAWERVKNTASELTINGSDSFHVGSTPKQFWNQLKSNNGKVAGDILGAVPEFWDALARIEASVLSEVVV